MRNANRITLGAFVIVSAVLLVGGFLLVGIAQFFAPHYGAMTVLNSSVEGLGVGSPVKYMGLPIGRVTRMAMRSSDGFIDIYFDIYGSALDAIDNHRPQSASDVELLRLLRQQKLSCILNASGLMGGTYLEIVGFGAESDGNMALPELQVTPPDGRIYIPSRTSHVSSAIQNMGKMLDTMSRIDLVALQDKVDYTLDKVNALLDENDLGQINQRLAHLLGNLEESSNVLKSAMTEKNVESFVSAISYLEQSLRDWRGAVPPERLQSWADNISSLLTEWRAFTGDARHLIEGSDTALQTLESSGAALRRRIDASLTALDNALREFLRIFNNFEDDPAQILRGRSDAGQ